MTDRANVKVFGKDGRYYQPQGDEITVIMSLSPVEQDLYANLVDAAIANDAAEDEIKIARAAILPAHNNLQRAEAALLRAAPRHDFQAEWRRMQRQSYVNRGIEPPAHLVPPPEDTEQKQAHADAEAEVAAAKEALDAARAASDEALQAIKPIRVRMAAALQAWRGPGLTPEQNVRQHINNSQERKASVAAGLEPETNAVRGQPASVLDAYRQHIKGPAGVSANMGRRPNEYAASNRGRRLRLPSEG
jgi:hypothetical protein